MPNLISQIATQLPQASLSAPLNDAGEVLRSLVEAEAYVGEVVSLGYSEAIVQIHDHHRQRVGGIPALCFLLATRVNPTTAPDAREEDASVILLRVTDQADLPNADEARRVRVENAQRVSGEIAVNWDDRAVYGCKHPSLAELCRHSLPRYRYVLYERRRKQFVARLEAVLWF